MGKIHTHYDNLKVSRMAPQEVIRAAYKALSQKYHPDKNPGDEKAARIMAILNSAYDTLSDTQRRKEHDEWIAAEEWEIEWLESTHHEDHPPRGDKGRGEAPDKAWHAEHVHDTPRRKRRDWKWWGGLAFCLMLGWIGGVTMVAEPRLVSSMLASAWGGSHSADKADAGGAAVAATPAKPPELRQVRADASAAAAAAADPRDAWAVARPYFPEVNAPKPPPIKVMAQSQIVLPAAGADCGAEEQTLAAPNGEPWPSQSGYVDGYPVGNRGEEMQLTLDNGANASAVFVKVYDQERHANVRYVFVHAHDKLVVDKLTTGKYEIRYQNVDVGANQSGCAPGHTVAAETTAASAPASN